MSKHDNWGGGFNPDGLEANRLARRVATSGGKPRINKTSAELAESIKDFPGPNPRGDIINTELAQKLMVGTKLLIRYLKEGGPIKVYYPPIGSFKEKVSKDADRIARYKAASEAQDNSYRGNNDLYSAERKQLGERWEALLFYNLQKWLGDKVDVYTGSDHDDWINKTDLILHIKGTEYYLTVDAATGIDMQKKEDHIRTLYYRSEPSLNTVDYFMEEDGSITAKQGPHILLGANREHITDLSGEWAKSGDINDGCKKMVLTQFLRQLNAYHQLFLKSEKGAKLADAFEVFIPIIQEALAKIPDGVEIPEDDTNTAIIDFLPKEKQAENTPPKEKYEVISVGKNGVKLLKKKAVGGTV